MRSISRLATVKATNQAPVWTSSDFDGNTSVDSDIEELEWDGTGPNGQLALSGPHFVWVDFEWKDDDMMDLEEGGLPGITGGAYIFQKFTVINNEDDKSWPNASVLNGFTQYKRYMEPAGRSSCPFTSTHQWHHIVEQGQSQFGPAKINSSHNLYRVPHDVHAKITNYYNSLIRHCPIAKA